MTLPESIDIRSGTTKPSSECSRADILAAPQIHMSRSKQTLYPTVPTAEGGTVSTDAAESMIGSERDRTIALALWKHADGL